MIAGMKHVIVGTAGHIDHGKSALVQALTGTDPESVQESLQRHLSGAGDQAGFSTALPLA